MNIPQVIRNRRIVNEDGTPTLEFIQTFEAIRRAFSEVGEVSKPTGGSTVDAEARAAINAIIDAL